MSRKPDRIDASWYRKPPGIPKRFAAGGVVIRPEGSKLWLALVSEGDLPRYVLPKGGIEPGETAAQAAIRETWEEAGFSDLRLRAFLGITVRLSYEKSWWVTTRFFLMETHEMIGHPTDVSRKYVQKWFDLNDPNLPMYWPDQKKLIEAVRGRIQDIYKKT